MDKAIKAMLANLDPYTSILTSRMLWFKINNTGEYTSMGYTHLQRRQTDYQRTV
jgi:hypothetical protein